MADTPIHPGPPEDVGEGCVTDGEQAHLAALTLKVQPLWGQSVQGSMDGPPMARGLDPDAPDRAGPRGHPQMPQGEGSGGRLRRAGPLRAARTHR